MHIDKNKNATEKEEKEPQTMGHTQARHFLKTFLKAVATHDYESVEQLRRTLAIEHYRRSLNRGKPICETEVVPKTGEVERWLTQMNKNFGDLGPEISQLLKSLEEPGSS